MYGPEELKEKAEKIHKLAMEVTFKSSAQRDSDHNTRDAVKHANGEPCGGDDVAIGPGPICYDSDKASVSGYYRQYTDQILEHIRPYPAELDALVKSVKQVEHRLGVADGTIKMVAPGSSSDSFPGLLDATMDDHMDSMEAHVRDWNGLFAENLRHAVVNPIDVIHKNNVFALNVFTQATEAIYLVNLRKRQTLTGIVDEVISALNEAKNTLDFLDGDELKTAIFVAGAAVAIGTATIANPPLGVAIGSATLGVVVGLAKDELPKKESLDFMSETPAHVIEKMGTALKKMHDEYEKSLAEITSTLRENVGMMEKALQAPNDDYGFTLFTIPRPSIVGEPGSPPSADTIRTSMWPE
ncbi:hypothetical protein [Stackebrandtia nassauensis]|uniref:Uncharacterized protein n=1 Tax=Stackebrandtia nassauensis (strain DSM 44728 / CIP 108903 / NRRL B-16338 / NBRC 102104 / LLR-40K-21) TaxID=446470 RepID=D3Q190_STANL|nr:hypothetical protein [Stackebrandtia nassauensis]ADD45670.1 hypothetical protein Snas_6046 [Stackebrandtia nassauensis DSM 44728]